MVNGLGCRSKWPCESPERKSPLGGTQLTLPSHTWDIAFGTNRGRSLEDRAKSSNRTFVRSLDHLAFDSPDATGQKLTAYEVLSHFGEEKIAEILEYGTAILVSDPHCPSVQPGKRIRSRRLALGLSPSDLARKVGIIGEEITTLENGSSRLPARTLTRICSALSLDEYKIGLEDPSSKERDLGVRFRQLQTDLDNDGTRLTKSSTLSLLEDAWLISKQNELRRSLGQQYAFRSEFVPNTDYGHAQKPAWRIGYELAFRTRAILGLGPEDPIENLRSLVEDRLHIPLIQDKLPRNIAGATVQSGDDRGIVVNTEGKFFNTWSARLTIAHELGHLLWDPDNRLNSLIVDTNDRLRESPWQADTYVEQRANAFAIEFLAPKEAIIGRFRNQYNPPDDIFDFMVAFGVSFIAARYHIWNATHRIWDLNDISTSEAEPTEDWEGRERFLTTFIPSQKLEAANFRMNRRGKFLSNVVDARHENLISDDTAALYLGIEPDLLPEVEYIRNTFFDHL